MILFQQQLEFTLTGESLIIIVSISSPFLSLSLLVTGLNRLVFITLFASVILLSYMCHAIDHPTATSSSIDCFLIHHLPLFSYLLQISNMAYPAVLTVACTGVLL